MSSEIELDKHTLEWVQDETRGIVRSHKESVEDYPDDPLEDQVKAIKKNFDHMAKVFRFAGEDNTPDDGEAMVNVCRTMLLKEISILETL